VASPRSELYRSYDVPETREVAGALMVNPLYRIERRDGAALLTLTFPTPEYEEEFGACKSYLPAEVTVNADLSGPIEPSALGAQYEELRRRRVILDGPPRYC